MPDQMNDGDAISIDYFINEKGDIDRWCDWQNRRPIVAAKYPELIDALERINISKRNLSAVVSSIKRDFGI